MNPEPSRPRPGSPTLILTFWLCSVLIPFIGKGQTISKPMMDAPPFEFEEFESFVVMDAHRVVPEGGEWSVKTRAEEPARPYVEWTGGAVSNGIEAFEDETRVLRFPFRIHGWGNHRILLRHMYAESADDGLFAVRVIGMELLSRDEPGGSLKRLHSPWTAVRGHSRPGEWAFTTHPVGDQTDLFVRFSPGNYFLEVAPLAPGVCLERVVLAHHWISKEDAANPELEESARIAPRPWRLRHTFAETPLSEILLDRDEWEPYPRATNRAAWEAVAPDVRADLIREGEKSLGYGWPALTASAFIDYFRTGSRESFNALFNDRRNRLAALVLAECAEGEGRFLDDIANGIWVVSEQTWWGIPAHLRESGPVRTRLPDVERQRVDLFAPEIGSLLAWTSYLLRDQLDEWSPGLRQRIQYEIDRRILTPFLEEDMGWMGLPSRWVNNHATSINAHVLPSALLIETDPDRRAALVTRIVHILDNFLRSQEPDGGCEEGPGYWNRAAAAFFESLVLLESATNGAVDLFNDPFFRDIAAYFAKMHIVRGEFFPYGDADRFTRTPEALVVRIARHLDLPDLERMGLYLLQEISENRRERGFSAQGHLGRRLPELFHPIKIPDEPVTPPMMRDVWLPYTEIFAARDQEDSEEGFYVAAMGAHNSQSHNHNDAGVFILYYNGEPVFIDAGRENYSSIAFDYSQRYTLWYTQSAWHNLPTVNGVMQADGRWRRAREVAWHADDHEAWMRMEISTAYPEEAGLERFTREVRLVRGKEVLVSDAFQLSASGQVEWNFITICDIDTGTPGSVRLTTGAGDTVTLHYAADRLHVAVDKKEMTDSRMQSAWGETLYRVRLQLREDTADGEIVFRVTH